MPEEELAEHRRVLTNFYSVRGVDGSALGIEVADGRLVCGSHQGTKSPQFGTFAGSDGGRRVKLRQ